MHDIYACGEHCGIDWRRRYPVTAGCAASYDRDMFMRQDQPLRDRLPPNRSRFLGVFFDCVEQSAVISLLQERRTGDTFRYVVTPNVDHIVRLAAQPAMLAQYQQAWLCLCDSRPVQLLSKTVARPLTHVTGSDLTRAIFQQVLARGDRVTLIVAHDGIATALVRQYPDVSFRWHVPPMGLLGNPDALQAAAKFIVDHPARFVFVAVGSPQSELIVVRAQESGQARGTALCVGASLEFITGDRSRAPAWMTRSGIEWTHRIATEPRRLWKRYVFSVPPLIKLYWKELTQRSTS